MKPLFYGVASVAKGKHIVFPVYRDGGKTREDYNAVVSSHATMRLALDEAYRLTVSLPEKTDCCGAYTSIGDEGIEYCKVCYEHVAP